MPNPPTTNLSPAQRRAYALMREAPDCTVRAGEGAVTRRTVEAMEKLGLVEMVERFMSEKTVHHRGGTTSRLTVVKWAARLRLIPPDAVQAVLLDWMARTMDLTEMTPELRERLAAYLALAAPRLDSPGTSAEDPDYEPHVAFRLYLEEGSADLISMWRRFRLTAAQQTGPDDGPTTDTWVLTDVLGCELGRVPGGTRVEAALRGNALLKGNGYEMRRLRQRELERDCSSGGQPATWVHDFSAGGEVHRVVRVDDPVTVDCDDATVWYEAVCLSSRAVTAVRESALHAEADTRASIGPIPADLISPEERQARSA